MSVKVERTFWGFTKAVIGATALVAMGGVVAAGKFVGALLESDNDDTDKKRAKTQSKENAGNSDKANDSENKEASSESKSE